MVQPWTAEQQARDARRAVAKAVADEFTEDNEPTRNAYLREWFEISLDGWFSNGWAR